MQWSQLELDLVNADVAVAVDSAPAFEVDRHPDAPGTDPVAAWLRQQAAYANPRQRQGVIYRAAMAPCELAFQARELRVRCQAGSAPAVLTTVALVVGIPPALVPGLPLQGNDSSAVVPDPVRGWVSLDFGKIFLGGAARAPVNETALPATQVLLKPLPDFLAEIIRAAFKGQPRARRLGDLFGHTVPGPHEPLDGRAGGRLRPTCVRLRSALPAFALRLGLDPFDAALVTGEMSLVPRSRFFYVRSDPERIAAGCRICFDALGWGSPVTLDVVLPFGSQMVPSTASVQRVHRQLSERVDAARPGRRIEPGALIELHNRFVIATGWLISFTFGSREVRRLDVSSDRCLPGVAVMEYADKLTGAFRRIQPVLFCRTAQDQVRAFWDHLVHLGAFADKAGIDPAMPWRAHLASVLAHRRVPLLFLVHRQSAVPIGTAHIQLGLDRNIRLAPNAGRHFWQTVLHDHDIPSEAINVWARHGSAGIEPMTSTSTVAIDEARARVCAVQDEVLSKLGIVALAGLGSRSTR